MIASGRWNPLESVRISLKRRVEQTPYRLWEILVREILVRERESTAKRLEENNQCNPCLEGTKWRVSSCLSSTHTWDPARKQWGTRWGNRLNELREGTERRNLLNELSEGTEGTGWRNWNEEPRERNRNKDQKERRRKQNKKNRLINYPGGYKIQALFVWHRKIFHCNLEQSFGELPRGFLSPVRQPAREIVGIAMTKLFNIRENIRENIVWIELRIN